LAKAKRKIADDRSADNGKPVVRRGRKARGLGIHRR
jgi:hypothetical protein